MLPTQRVNLWFFFIVITRLLFAFDWLVVGSAVAFGGIAFFMIASMPFQRHTFAFSQGPVEFVLLENFGGEKVEVEGFEKVRRRHEFHIRGQTLTDPLAEVIVNVEIFNRLCFLRNMKTV